MNNFERLLKAYTDKTIEIGSLRLKVHNLEQEVGKMNREKIMSDSNITMLRSQVVDLKAKIEHYASKKDKV